MDCYFIIGSTGNDSIYFNTINAVFLVKKMENRKKIAEKTKSLLLKLSTILGIIILFFVLYRLSGVVYQQKGTTEEIASLQMEVDRLNKDNQNLEELISYFQTDEFKEKEAKDKLNLVKKGEKVVFLKEKEVIKKKEMPDQKPEVTVDRPNYYYWWCYFFSI